VHVYEYDFVIFWMLCDAYVKIRSLTTLTFKIGFETAMNFKTVEKSLHCFWKWEERL